MVWLRHGAVYPLATREGPADDVLTPACILEEKYIALEIRLDFVRIRNTTSVFSLS